MKKFAILFALTSLCYAEKEGTSLKTSKLNIREQTTSDERPEVSTTDRAFAAAKVGGSALAIGYLAYVGLDCLRTALFYPDKEAKLGWSFRVDRYNQNLKNFTAKNLTVAGLCGFAIYKLGQVAFKNAPIAINGK